MISYKSKTKQTTHRHIDATTKHSSLQTMASTEHIELVDSLQVLGQICPQVKDSKKRSKGEEKDERGTIGRTADEGEDGWNTGGPADLRY
ncbi:hypothetical protein LZ554_009555 [Drepanopeziza brunnea f. sp. 'monogermtubi']|nr:hypothetical protein LZ554_009555 [Drepanopeziza brunnea f. sp. 'monogermtubi']